MNSTDSRRPASCTTTAAASRTPQSSSSSSSSSSWAERQISLDTLARKIPNGSNVYIGSGPSTPQASLAALVDSFFLQDITIIQMIPGGNLPHLAEHPDQFRSRSFFSFTKTTYYKAQQQQQQQSQQQQHPNNNHTSDDDQSSPTSTTESLADYSPMSISAVPRLLREQMLRVDVALIKVSAPHKGFCSLGLGVEYTHAFIQHATHLVIAEVTPHMPWTEGPSKIPLSQIDYWIALDESSGNNNPAGCLLQTTQELWPQFAKETYNNGPFQDTSAAIGKNVVTLIPNGATLKFGINVLSFGVVPFLKQKQDLGIHTDVFIEALFQLQRDGVITNACKTIDKGRTVVAAAHGSPNLYEFCDRNPAIEFHPSSYVNDPTVMGKIDNFIAIVGALKVDLTGQVATESIAHKFYGGVWSDVDSVMGARLSKGGKAIVCLPAQSLHGRRSNVVFALPQGTGVSITRADVEYVVTEYGVAYLYGKSIRERCLALIDIAHPDYRTELLAAAKANHYISSSQPGLSFASRYPAQLECRHQTKKGKKVFCRPIKAVDEDLLRHFFHKLSDHSVYLRYFRKIKSLPQRILQKTADVDYISNMALVVLYPPEDAAHQELVGLAQWIQDKQDGLYEISFQVRDDWQGEGLGKFLFARLLTVAREFGLDQFKADVLAGNVAMRRVLETSGVPNTRKTDFGVVTYHFDLMSRHATGGGGGGDGNKQRDGAVGEEFFDCTDDDSQVFGE